jgi:hypothetical protein
MVTITLNGEEVHNGNLGVNEAILRITQAIETGLEGLGVLCAASLIIVCKVTHP